MVFKSKKAFAFLIILCFILMVYKFRLFTFSRFSLDHSAAVLTDYSKIIPRTEGELRTQNLSTTVLTHSSDVNSQTEGKLSTQNLSTTVLTDSFDIKSPYPKTEEELRNLFAQTPYIFDKFTMVTPTYKRTENLHYYLDNYCSMTDIIHKIVILWNNIGESVPYTLIDHAQKCAVPVVIKIMMKNNLTSRFIPFPEIETAGILSIDDDVELSNTSIHTAFNTWKRYPYLLVGYTPRSYHRKGTLFKYGFNEINYTMIMTNVAFIHHIYLELFTHTVPKPIIDYIIKTQNGEDLTMNVVIGKYLTELGHPMCVGIHVTFGYKEVRHLSTSGYKGLSLRPSHIKQRGECLTLLAKVYHELYLHTGSKTV